MNNIKRVSFFFRVLFQCFFIMYPISLVMFWINAPAQLGGGGFFISFIPQGTEILHALNPTEKLLGLFISIIPMVVFELMLIALIKLFRLYEKSEIFSLQNVNYIKKVGYLLLISQLLELVYQPLMTFAMTYGNGHGHRVASITIGNANVGILLVALITILISWIMAEGCKLREEQQYTI